MSVTQGGGQVNGSFPACYMIEAYNVDGFTLTSKAGPAILSGFLYDEHKNPRPPAGMYVLNCTNVLWENVRFQHVRSHTQFVAAGTKPAV